MRNHKIVSAIRMMPYFAEGNTPTPTPTGLENDPAFKKMMNMVSGLATLVQQNVTSVAGLSQTVAKMTSTTPTPTPTPSKGPSEDEIEAMDQKAFGKFILGEVGKLLDTKLTEVNTRIESSTGEFRRFRLTEEYKKLADDHKDFKDWEEDMHTLAKTHQTLGLHDLYMLSRAQKPDKAKELDEKYADPKPKDEGMTIFGGYRPTSGKTGSGNDDGKKLTVDEALDKAWSEQLNQFPALAKVGEDDLVD
jgi:hypothetical protein